MQQPKVADKNTPYWWEAAPVKPLPPQPLAKKLDVAIVGAGYAGLSAGLVLAREGRSVAAFDAMNPGEGASSRNGGVTSGTIRPDYATITRRFGEEKAMAIEAEGKIAREFLYDFIKTEGLDCDFRLVGAVQGSPRIQPVRDDGPRRRGAGEETGDRILRRSACRAAKLHRHRLLSRRHGPDGHRRTAPGQVPRRTPAGGVGFGTDGAFEHARDRRSRGKGTGSAS